MTTATQTSSGLRVMISRDEIAKRVHEIGEQINKDYAGEKVVVLDPVDDTIAHNQTIVTIANLREIGMTTRGPAPFSKADRSRFLSTLDAVVQAALRG